MLFRLRLSCCRYYVLAPADRVPILFLAQVSNNLSCLEDVKPLVELLDNLLSTFLALFSKSRQTNEKEAVALRDLNSELMEVPSL